MRYLLAITLFVFTFFVMGLRWGNIGERGAQLYFSMQPIQKDNINNVGRYFRVRERIYYHLYNPKGFRDEYIRVQIVKKDEKVNHWGYKVYWSKDYHIDSSQKDFSSYVVLNETGYYFMQIFSFDDFDRVIARNDFWVK
jgi:hypothetical protein